MKMAWQARREESVSCDFGCLSCWCVLRWRRSRCWSWEGVEKRDSCNFVKSLRKPIKSITFPLFMFLWSNWQFLLFKSRGSYSGVLDLRCSHLREITLQHRLVELVSNFPGSLIRSSFYGWNDVWQSHFKRKFRSVWVLIKTDKWWQEEKEH
jgi:hypothetical protein